MIGFGEKLDQIHVSLNEIYIMRGDTSLESVLDTLNRMLEQEKAILNFGQKRVMDYIDGHDVD
jgi:hypothetical protein